MAGLWGADSGVSDAVCFPQHPGTVNGVNNSEMRFLTARNTGTGVCSSAIQNNSASPRLTHVTAEATGSGNINSAVFNANNSSPTMTDVTATASGVTLANYGVWNQRSSSTTIRQSKLSGSTNSLFQQGGTAKVALTQLVGQVSGSTLQYFNNYNENMAAVTCP
jgi:hypothetical protein